MLEWMPPSTAIAAVRVSDIWNHFDSTIFDEMVLLLLGNLRGAFFCSCLGEPNSATQRKLYTTDVCQP